MSLNFAVLGILGARCGLGSRDHHFLSGRDAGYGFRDGISRDLSIFPRFSHFFAIFDDVGLSGREISVTLQKYEEITAVRC